MTKFIGRLALAVVALAAGTGAAAAGHATAAHADPAVDCHQYQFLSSFLELNLPLAGNRLDQENALPTDAKAIWCLQPFKVNGETVASQVVNKQSGDCMVARKELGAPIFAEPCSVDLGSAWTVNRGSYNGTRVVWFTSYVYNVNVDVYHDRRDSGAPIVGYRPSPPTPTRNEMMLER